MTPGPEGPDSHPGPPPASSPHGIREPAPYREVDPSVPSVTDPPLSSIGDITITRSQVITPAGTLPLRGSVWTVTDMSRTEQYMPTHAVVLAIVFFVFCLLGLLFLLMKETRTVGYVQVTVNGGGRYHSTMIPVSSPQQVHQVMEHVNWARSMAA